MFHRLLSSRSIVACGSGGLLLALSGCGEAPPGESAESSHAAVVFGERSTDSDDTVVQVLAHPTDSIAQSCTGTMVAPNIVLTALHCVAQYNSADINCRPDGTSTSDTKLLLSFITASTRPSGLGIPNVFSDEAGTIRKPLPVRRSQRVRPPE